MRNKLTIGVTAGLAAMALACGSAGEPEGKDIAGKAQAQPKAKAARHKPAPKDFTITVKTLDKTCFGSAGCNVEYRIQPKYAGPALPDDQTTEVTYEVNGLEDPEIGTFTMNGTKAEVDSSESGSTSSSSKKITAKVTTVEVL